MPVSPTRRLRVRFAGGASSPSPPSVESNAEDKGEVEETLPRARVRDVGVLEQIGRRGGVATPRFLLPGAGRTLTRIF